MLLEYHMSSDSGLRMRSKCTGGLHFGFSLPLFYYLSSGSFLAKAS